MSSAFRHTASARHPALNRLPRDFLSAARLPLPFDRSHTGVTS